MTGSFFSMTSDRDSPTLWPLHPDNMTPTELALEVSIKENKLLKKMVVDLSDILLELIVSRK
jgi:hypothetical protein